MKIMPLNVTHIMSDVSSRDELFARIQADLNLFLVGTAEHNMLGRGSRWDYHLSIGKIGDQPYEIWLDHIGIREDLRSVQIFSDVLEYLENHPLVGQICVGNLQNKEFRDFFVDRGYTLDGDKHVCRYPKQQASAKGAEQVPSKGFWSKIGRLFKH
jgi:hypothetical protein